MAHPDKVSPEEKGAPPVFKTKVGRVQMNVWEQETKSGTMLSVTLKRSYRDQDGNFKDAYNFSVQDLADMRRCIDEVEAWASKKGGER